MTTQIHSAQRDVTASQPARGSGMFILHTWMCGHQHRLGQKRSMGKGIPALMWRCADCVGKKA